MIEIKSATDTLMSHLRFHQSGFGLYFTFGTNEWSKAVRDNIESQSGTPFEIINDPNLNAFINQTLKPNTSDTPIWMDFSSLSTNDRGTAYQSLNLQRSVFEKTGRLFIFSIPVEDRAPEKMQYFMPDLWHVRTVTVTQEPPKVVTPGLSFRNPSP